MSSKGSGFKISTGIIHSVETFGALDGPGIRYVVFFQGCPLRCRYCHNPDTWLESAPAAQPRTAQALVDDALRYRSYLTGGGVTLSGGEPLAQPEFAAELLTLFKSSGFHTAVDTSGCMPLSVCEKAVSAADLILLDIKAIEPALCKEITGADNRNALRLLDYCERAQKAVWVRHVLVPELTLKPAALEKLAAYLSGYTCVKKVELLPYHSMGEHKWKALGIPYSLQGTAVPDAAQQAEARAVFERFGLPL